MNPHDKIFALALTIARTEALLSKAEHERDQARAEVQELKAQLAEAKKPKPRTRKS